MPAGKEFCIYMSKKKKKLLFKNDMFYKVNVRDLTKKKVIPEFDQARKTLSLEHQLII